MGLRKEGRTKKIWLLSFHLFSTTSITLLLPLSYLVLGKLASIRYLLSLPSESPPPLLSSFLFYTNPNILSTLVSILSLSALIHSLTGLVSPGSGYSGRVLHPRVRDAWFFLGAVQVCVGLGIEGSREAAVKGAVFEGGKSLLSKVFMLVGMHETMVCWARTMVRPVVDAGVLGGPREGSRWVERAVIGVSFGGLWWWKLKHEVEALVAVVEVKRHMMIRVGLSDVLGWWLYYLTLFVGVCRLAMGILWVGLFIFYGSGVDHKENGIEFSLEGEDKV